MSAESSDRTNKFVAANGCPQAKGCWFLNEYAKRLGADKINTNTPIRIHCEKDFFAFCARVPGSPFYKADSGFPKPISFEEIARLYPRNGDFRE